MVIMMQKMVMWMFDANKAFFSTLYRFQVLTETKFQNALT